MVLLVGPAVFDTTLVVISRVSHGRPIYIGGTDHTSHRLLLLGIPRVGVTAVLIGGTAASCTLGVLVAEGAMSPWVAVPVALVPALAALTFLLRMGVYSDDGRGRHQLVVHPSRTLRHGPPAPRPRRTAPRFTRARVHLDGRPSAAAAQPPELSRRRSVVYRWVFSHHSMVRARPSSSGISGRQSSSSPARVMSGTRRRVSSNPGP